MIPRYGNSPHRDIRYRRRPGVYAVLHRAGDILLTHQEAPYPEFQLPGGGVDPGEHLLPALHREVMEETGWSITIERRLGAFRRFTYMPEYELWAEKFCVIYLGRPARRIGPPREQGHTAIWTPLRDASEMLGNPGDREFLRRLR